MHFGELHFFLSKITRALIYFCDDVTREKACSYNSSSFSRLCPICSFVQNMMDRGRPSPVCPLIRFLRLTSQLD